MARLGSTNDLGTTSQSPNQPIQSNFELEPFKTYLSQLVPILLGPDNIESLFDGDQFELVATRFASDPNQAVVYVVKERDQFEQVEGEYQRVAPTLLS